jgi:plastocyanin
MSASKEYIVNPRILIAGVALATMLAACSDGGSTPSANPPPEADLTVAAEDNAFDQATVTLTAGETTTVFFRNLDGSPHNIAIYTDDSASESLFVGDTISEDVVTYEIPALEPGEYFFRCDVHPSMTGVVVVEAA